MRNNGSFRLGLRGNGKSYMDLVKVSEIKSIGFADEWIQGRGGEGEEHVINNDDNFSCLHNLEGPWCHSLEPWDKGLGKDHNLWGFLFE